VNEQGGGGLFNGFLVEKEGLVNESGNLPGIAQKKERTYQG